MHASRVDSPLSGAMSTPVLKPFSAHTQLLDIPAAILHSIIQHVPVKERLGGFALVCRAFHAAAVAATNSIEIESMNSPMQFEDLLSWLKKYGNVVSTLKIQQGHWSSLKSLPCQHLWNLKLLNMSLQLVPTESHPGVLSTCTGLTKLSLTYCYVNSRPEEISDPDSNALTHFSVLTNLQHLHLTAAFAKKGYRVVVVDFPAILLSHLVRLTHLQLSHYQQSNALEHLSALSALQHLTLSNWTKPAGTSALVLPGLQHLQQLTALHLREMPWAILLHSLPGIYQCTALRELHLHSVAAVSPDVLEGLHQLQALKLDCSNAWSEEETDAMLAAVGEQTQLTRLEISHHRSWSAPSAAAYSSLTASSHLQHLELANCKLPAAAWQYMFPPSRCLPKLHRLEMHGGIAGQSSARHGPEDLQALAFCCPSISSFILGGDFEVLTVAPLLQLTGLTCLDVHTAFRPNAASIAQLTGLKRLRLSSLGHDDRVTNRGLVKLTVLRQLTHLYVKCRVIDSKSAGTDSLEIDNKVGGWVVGEGDHES